MACDKIRNSFKTLLMQRFVDRLGEGNGDSLFLAIGKTSPWNDETSPPVPIDTLEQETDFWRECIALKKVKTGDIALVVPRTNWSSGTLFDEYEDNESLFDENTPKSFFALVDEKRIYKVIDNNNGATSTVKPQEVTTNIFKTGDGYSWKFIYSISESDQKFLTTTFMPVFVSGKIANINDTRKNQFDTQNAATPGSVDFIDVVSTGDSFSNIIIGVSAGTHIISGTTAISGEYVLAGLNVSLADGLYFNYSLKVNDPSSSNYGEIRKITSYTGSTKTVALESDFTNNADMIGHDFSIIPTVVVSGDGSGIIAEAKMNKSSFIDSIDIITGGSNYTYTNISVFGGSSTATSTVLDGIISPSGGHGSNAIKELGAASLMISMTLDQTEDGLIQGNSDFRQFGLVANPTIGATVVGSSEDVIHSYFVTSTLPISDFDSFTGNLIGNLTGNTGEFNEYVATLGNALTGTLKIKNPTNRFIENDVIIKINSDYTSTVSTIVTIDRFLTEELEVNKDVYRQTTQLDITKIASDFSTTFFSEDLTIIGSSSGATGVVSSWNPDFVSGSGYSTTDGTLDLVKVVGIFNTDDTLSQIESNGSETLSKASVVSLNTPEIDYHSGDMLYLENIQVLERDVDQREEIRMILSI